MSYTDGINLTIFGPPRGPENLPSFGSEDSIPLISLEQLRKLIIDQPVACTSYITGWVVGVWYSALGMKHAIYIPIIPVQNLDLPKIPSPYLSYHVRNFDDLFSKRLNERGLQIKLLSILQWLTTLGRLPEFVIGPGRYDLSNLPVELPTLITYEKAVEYLESKTSGLIVQPGKIRVSSPRLELVFRHFVSRIAISGNPALRRVPLYLTGYYKNYRELDQTGGLVAVTDWQLNMQIGRAINFQLYKQIPRRLVGGKVEDSEVVFQPVFYLTEDNRPLMLINMRNLDQSTNPQTLRSKALHLAFKNYEKKLARRHPELNEVQIRARAEQDLPVLQRDPTGSLHRPYVDYYVDQDGKLQLATGDDRTGGHIPYLEVARLRLSDNTVYVLAVLRL